MILKSIPEMKKKHESFFNTEEVTVRRKLECCHWFLLPSGFCAGYLYLWSGTQGFFK
jgi:hypothetical protein